EEAQIDRMAQLAIQPARAKLPFAERQSADPMPPRREGGLIHQAGKMERIDEKSPVAAERRLHQQAGPSAQMPRHRRGRSPAFEHREQRKTGRRAEETSVEVGRNPAVEPLSD